MTTLRSLLFMAALAVVTISYAIYIILFGKWIGRSGCLACARGWSSVLLRALKTFCGLDHHVTGLEHLPTEPCILMCKHQSAWETIAVPSLLAGPQAWVLKKELMAVPFFGWALRRCRPIAIDRKAARSAMRQLLREGQEHLNEGYSILVFPEGTRVPVGTRAPFNIGGAMLAAKSGAPIVPLAHNAGVFWKRRALRKLPGRIELVVGPPIQSKGRSAKEINALAETWINETVEALPRSVV
jgi:1-acyl-sn-glycerol-3-phosphate acyltransferase